MQANSLEDFQPYKYFNSFSKGDTSVYDEFKQLYFDLRSNGITDMDESDFDSFARFNSKAGYSKLIIDEKVLQIIEKMEAAGESEQSISEVVRYAFEQFSSVEDSVKEKLYNTGLNNQVISKLTDLDLFKSAWDFKKKSVPEFANLVKSKYPQYNGMDDLELTKKILDSILSIIIQ